MHLYMEKDSSAKFWSGLQLGYDYIFSECVVVVRRGFLEGHSKCVVMKFTDTIEADKYLSKMRAKKLRGGYVEREVRNLFPPVVHPHNVPRNSKPRKYRPKSTKEEVVEEEVRIFNLKAEEDDDDDD